MATDTLPFPLDWPKPKWIGGFLGGLLGLWLAFTTLSSNVFTATTNPGDTGVDFFVDINSGVDNVSCGDTSSPCKNPEYVVSLAGWVPGATMCLRDGTYTNHDTDNYIIYMNAGDSGTSGSPVTIKACSGHSPLLRDTSTAYGLFMDGTDWVNVESLSFGDVDFTCLFLGNSSVSEGIVITGNTFTECGYREGNSSGSCLDTNGRSGIFAGGRSKNITITKNLFYSLGRARETACDSDPTSANNHNYRHDHGIYAQGIYHYISNNVFYDMYAGYSIKIDGHNSIDTGSLGSNEFSHIVSNNTFGPNTNPGPGIYNASSGASIRPFKNSSKPDRFRFLIQNNISLNQVYGFIYSPVYINNDASRPLSGAVCRNNVAETSDGGLDSYCSTHFAENAAVITESNSLLSQSAAQLDMVSPGTFDYSIQSNSVAINYGNCSSLGDNGITITEDFLGNSRINCDAGAYEYVGL
jgi:hypothetical protein